VPELLSLMQTCQDPHARLELALALARLVGDENFFVRLAREVRSDPDTPLAQSITSTEKRLEKAGLSGRSTAVEWNDCASTFSQGDYHTGVVKFLDLLSGIPFQQLRPVERVILDDCVQHLVEHGEIRMDYLLLALHTLYSCNTV